MADNKIELYRGDNADVQCVVVDVDGTAVNITGASIKFTVRSIQALTQQFQKTTAAGTVVITGAAAGKCVAYVLAADSAVMLPGRYMYDFEFTLATKVFTVSNEFTVLQDVTYV